MQCVQTQALSFLIVSSSQHSFKGKCCIPARFQVAHPNGLRLLSRGPFDVITHKMIPTFKINQLCKENFSRASCFQQIYKFDLRGCEKSVVK